MKKTVFLLFIFFLTLPSCKDVLDTKPLDVFTAEDIWSDYGLSEGVLFNCYASCIPYIYNWNLDAVTKSIRNNTGQGGGAYFREKSELFTLTEDFGFSPFQILREVNQILKNVAVAPFTSLQKNTLLGEAHFLRACLFANQAFRFGEAQIVRGVLTPADDFKIPRSSLRETYDFVLADLDTAAAMLEVTTPRGRAGKGAAYALQMRAGLQAGAYLNDNAYYTKVKEAGDLLFATGKYNLDEYANLFNAYSTAIVSAENMLIYEKRSTNTIVSNTPMIKLCPNSAQVSSKLSAAAMSKFPLKESLDGLAGYFPTQDLVDDYLVTDADGVEKKWDQTTYFKIGNSVNKKMYQRRDLRFYASIVYDSNKYFNNWVYLRADGNVLSGAAPSNGGNINSGGSTTGYLFAKYLYQQVKLTGSASTDYCYSVLRLGEAYLNYAEAALRLGDEATARTYISKTFRKHGGFKNDITAAGNELWTAYKRERHVEMILETGDRYWSLLRWGMQASGGLKEGYETSGYIIPELNGKIRNIAISADGRAYKIFESNDVSGELRFTPKRYLLPVPLPKIQSSPWLKQNPGW